MKYCKGCTYPEVAVNIKFDEKGYSSTYKSFHAWQNISSKEWKKRKKIFEKIVLNIKKNNKSNYDCIIAVSGGKDSYYQTHIIVKEYGLKPLLMTYHGNNFLPEGDFNRDKMRLINNFNNLKVNPLGSVALSGTSFNIDRNFTTKKLGFKTPTSNSIDTVSDRDFVLDFLFASSLCAMHISRLAEEFIIWNSDGFRLINLHDNILTGSSIMPQKKNPDSLEYLRGKVGSSYGNLFSMMTILKGLPLSYFKDLQDDKKIVFDTFDNLIDSIKVLNEVLKNFSVNKNEMLSLAKKGHITATDLADYLVKNLNYPL